MAHQLIGRRAAPCSPFGVQAGYYSEDNRSSGNGTEQEDHSTEICPDRQSQGNVGNRIADIVEIGTEPAADVKLTGQNTVQVIHNIVEDDQRDQIAVAVILEQ